MYIRRGLIADGSRWPCGRGGSRQRDHKEAEAQPRAGNRGSMERMQNEATGTQVRRAQEDQERERNPNSKFWLWYHVMNSTFIHYEGSRPEYIHVQVLENMYKTPYTTRKLQKIHIHLTILKSKLEILSLLCNILHYLLYILNASIGTDWAYHSIWHFDEILSINNS